MLNNKGERELAYIVKVEKITPMDADRLECAHIGGWNCVVGKGEFHEGDPAVYFEIDSKLPEKEPFSNMEFLVSKHYKIKSQKIRGVVSQGLLVSVTAFGWTILADSTIYGNDGDHSYYNIGDFVTDILGVTYSTPEDNYRKTSHYDKYKRMAQQHPRFFRRPLVRKLMKYDWFKKTAIVFFPVRSKVDKWPSHIAAKTDVERIQNMVWILEDKRPFVATEKVDGTSCSVMAERKKFGKIAYYVCSRNVVFKNPDQNCFYDTNVYFEAFECYNLKKIITQILNEYNLPNLAIQMEVYGEGIQKRDYSIKDHRIAVFHMVSNGVKFPMEKTVEICEKYGLPHVAIVDANYILPDTIDELCEYVEGEPSEIDGGMREGIVFYDKTGQQYFKFVSPNYLLKYHN